MSEVLALIPARGGSKGLPRKNLCLLHGHPLVAYAIAAGLQAQYVTRTVCSTDDSEIAVIAEDYGAEVPFLRPPELAQDSTPDLAVFQHALNWFHDHENWRPDFIVQLRPTSPLRFPGQVDEAVQLLVTHCNATGVRSVCPAPCNPYKMWHLPQISSGQLPFMVPLFSLAGISEPYNFPRQKLPTAWWQTGSIDVARSYVILEGSMTGGRLLPLYTDNKYAVDIDSKIGVQIAGALMAELDCIRPRQLRETFTRQSC